MKTPNPKTGFDYIDFFCSALALIVTVALILGIILILRIVPNESVIPPTLPNEWEDTCKSFLEGKGYEVEKLEVNVKG